MASIQTVGRRRAPGTRVFRTAGVGLNAGVSVSDIGFIGIAKKGPLDKRVECPDFETFEKNFGGYYNSNYLYPSVKAAFEAGENNIGTVHVVRIAGSGAAVASKMLDSYSGASDNTILAQAKSPGAGFTVELNDLKFQAGMTSSLSSGTTSVVLDNVSLVEQGDLIQFNGTGAGATYAFVQNVAVSTKTVTILPPLGMGGGTLTSGTQAYISTVHKSRTTLTSNYSSGTSSLAVLSPGQFFRGQRIYVSDKTNHGTAVVKGINGSNIVLQSPIGSNISASGSFVVSQEFNLDVYEDGILEETHQFLSLEDEAACPNEIDHIEVRLSGELNESKIVVLADQDAEDSTTAQSHLTGFESILAIPITFSNVTLTGGSDGATPTASEWLGTDSVSNPTGIYLFNKTNNVRAIGMPGQTTVSTVKAAQQYCESHPTKGDCQFITDVPLASDDYDEALNYRKVTLAIATPYVELLYPWVYVQHPEAAGSNIQMPLSPFYMGLLSKANTVAGLKQNAAGVIHGVLPGSVLGLTKEIGMTEHGLLNEAGIICAVFSENFGYHIQGVRTLNVIENGFHWANIQHLTNYIQASLHTIGLPFVMLPNTSDTRIRLREAVDRFMKALFDNGEFEPTDNKELAYNVKCDSENNTKPIVNAGNLVCDVSFNGPSPAEVVNFRLGRRDNNTFVSKFSQAA